MGNNPNSLSKEKYYLDLCCSKQYHKNYGTFNRLLKERISINKNLLKIKLMMGKCNEYSWYQWDWEGNS